MLDVHLEQDGAGSEDKFIESLTNKIMSIKPINNVINIGSPGSYKAPAEVEAAYDEAGFNGVAQTLFMRKFMNIDVKTGEITANDKNIEGWDNKKVINNLAKTGQLKVPDEGEKEKYDKLMGQVPEKDKKAVEWFANSKDERAAYPPSYFVQKYLNELAQGEDRFYVTEFVRGGYQKSLQDGKIPG